MVTDATVRLTYILGHLITALVSITVGYWIVFRTEMRARYLYGVYALVNVTWSLVSAAAVAAPPGPVFFGLWAVWFTVPIISAVCLLAFGSEFTGRHWRQSLVVRGFIVAATVIILFPLTAPFHNLYLQSMTIVTEPFAHLDYSFGVTGIAAVLLILSCEFLTYYYFVELYLKSRHRPSSAMIVIVAGILLGLIPFVLSRLDIGLVATYDHTSFGIVFAAVSFAFAAFRLDLSDVTPLARDEAIQSLSDPYLVINDSGALIDYNPTARTVLDISEDDIGTQVADVAPTVATAIERNQKEITLSSGGTELHFDLNISLISGPVDDHRGTQVLMRDVTARKKREERLKELNTRLELALEETNTGVWEWEVDTGEMRWDEASETLFGYDAGEFPGTFAGFTDRVVEDDLQQVEEQLDHAIETGELYRANFRIRLPQGTQRWVQARGVVKYGDNGTPTRVLGIQTDITDLKEYEQELEDQNKKLEVLNRIVRHDIRNDMSVILGSARRVGGTLDDHEARDWFEQVIESGEHVIEITEVVGDIMDTMLSDTDSTRLVGLDRVLEEELDAARSMYENAVFDGPDTDGEVVVRADEMLSAVFRNLLTNAVRHNDSDQPRVSVSITDAGEQTVVTVADNGRGVSDDRKDEIFGRGEKGLESPGTGLGLYLVDTLVTGYGGEITVEDSDLGGAAFIIRLPTTT